uniref:Coiled-coil-helix-coiled-coil-helix domain containing 3 n=1 Tax=Buteo japonicus TaxID=224669 RepID=A0A8C0BML8_9AVES
MLCCVNISFNFLLIVVNDEELKKRIAEELALERARRDSEAQKRRLTGSRNLRKQLKQEQMYVRDEFGKLLERERISSNEHLTRAILRERAATEEERQKAQRFAKQLEEKDRELKKHDAYYKEQLARLEERVSLLSLLMKSFLFISAADFLVMFYC